MGKGVFVCGGEAAGEEQVGAGRRKLLIGKQGL